MTTVPFDTLKLADRLQGSGASRNRPVVRQRLGRSDDRGFRYERGSCESCQQSGRIRRENRHHQVDVRHDRLSDRDHHRGGCCPRAPVLPLTFQPVPAARTTRATLAKSGEIEMPDGGAGTPIHRADRPVSARQTDNKMTASRATAIATAYPQSHRRALSAGPPFELSAVVP